MALSIAFRRMTFLLSLALAAIATQACVVPPIVLPPAPAARVTIRELLAPSRSGSGTNTNEDLRATVEAIAANARQELQTRGVLMSLQGYQRTIDAAKWTGVFLSAATTLVGTAGSNATRHKSQWATATLTIGSLTTIITAIRDDKDLASRIATCQGVARDGDGAIDAFYNKWIVLVNDVPTEPIAHGKFVQDLSADGIALAATVTKLVGTCR